MLQVLSEVKLSFLRSHSYQVAELGFEFSVFNITAHAVLLPHPLFPILWTRTVSQERKKLFYPRCLGVSFLKPLSWKVEPGITICLQAPWWAGHLDLWASFQLLSSKILLLGWFLRKSAKHVVSMKLKTYSHQPILVDSLCARIHKLEKIHILYYSWDHLLSMCSSDQIYPHTRNNYKNQTRHKSGFKDSERQTIKHRDP